MTGYALTAGAAILVMGVLFQSRGVWTIRRRWSVTVQAELVYRLSELRDVLGAVNVVTGSTCDTVLVHNALHEVIALHSILVCGPISEMSERRLA